HEERQENRGVSPDVYTGSRRSSLAPIRNCEEAQAWESKGIPIRRRGLVKGENCVEEKNRQPKPEEIEDLEIALRTSPTRHHCPDETKEQQRRIRYKVFSQKTEQLERMKPPPLV